MTKYIVKQIPTFNFSDLPVFSFFDIEANQRILQTQPLLYMNNFSIKGASDRLIELAMTLKDFEYTICFFSDNLYMLVKFPETPATFFSFDGSKMEACFTN